MHSVYTEKQGGEQESVKSPFNQRPPAVGRRSDYIKNLHKMRTEQQYQKLLELKSHSVSNQSVLDKIKGTLKRLNEGDVEAESPRNIAASYKVGGVVPPLGSKDPYEAMRRRMANHGSISASREGSSDDEGDKANANQA